MRARGGRPRPSKDTCDVSQHPKKLFYYVVGSVAIFSFYWCGAYLRWWSGMLLVGLYFIFSYSLSFYENYKLTLLVVNNSISVPILLIFLFWSYPSYKSFICFQFHHWIPIYQILYSLIWSSLFGFLIFCLGLFFETLIGLQFHDSIQIDGIMFFNLVLIFLSSNFLTIL